jgi:dipeptidyl aminopeptidase/acylaminoacyl peptidase
LPLVTDGPADARPDAFSDLAAFAALPRVTGLALRPDGARLVATVQQPDAAGARYATSLWTVPRDGGEPARLTRSDKGETGPAFLPDGSLLFSSARPDPGGEGDDAALWVLPTAGEPRVLARCAGGLTGAQVARDAGTVVAEGSRLVRSTAEDDAERRRTRAERKVTAILHAGMPIRQWDTELDVESPRLFHVQQDGVVRDLTPDAGQALVDAQWSLTADGATVATTWRTARRGGVLGTGVVLVDVATGTRTVLAEDADLDHSGPRISPDGSLVALLTECDGGYDQPWSWQLRIVPVDGAAAVEVATGDVQPGEWVWSADGGTLYVSGDFHGRGALLAVDATTGAVRRLAADAVYSSLCPAPDGRALFALRSAVDAAPAPVRLDAATAADQAVTTLSTPAPVPALPGRLEEVSVEVDGAPVRAWLCLPEGAEGPAPLMVWVHGGPFGSYNDWSWRWSPWVATARGWAVLLPDPALSTGYGPDWIARAWPHRAGLVWRDVEALADAVVARPDVDGSRTALLGASFGGYMTNWIAGHTDRFGAIVTHAGLWALDQQHDTTDAAHWKNRIFGEPDEHPDWYAENSPQHFVDAIRTPMLVLHGNRDYRVPVSEALRLWWDLVSRWDGEPADLPHRFLQFTGQNHWILTPADLEVWYDAVLGFCAEHVLGECWTPSALL